MSAPTMNDIAKAAGVSKNTVSLALRESSRVSPETRNRVLKIAADLGYRINPTVANLMAQLRQSKSLGYQATIAIVNAHQSRDAFTQHPTIPVYYQGCKQRSKQLGYQLDEFWLHEPDMPASRWLSIFRASNIRGMIIVGLMQTNRLPANLSKLWSEFPAIITGVRTREPALSFACSDHHSLALEAFEKAISLGYKRPGLVLDGVIDDLVEGRFTAGFLTAQSRAVPMEQRTPPFLQVSAAREDRSIFEKWLNDYKPDVIFTLYHEVERWLKELGLETPRDIGLIQYEWRPQHANWAGMNQRNDLVGEAAVDMLISMIHHNENGVPEHPRATLIGSHWEDGDTVKRAYK